MHSLTSALDGSEWSASPSPPERAADTHWIGGWVDPRAGLDAVSTRKKSRALAGNRIPVVQPVA